MSRDDEIRVIPQREFVFKNIEETLRVCSGVIYDLYKYNWRVSKRELKSCYEKLVREIEGKLEETIDSKKYDALSWEIWGGGLESKRDLTMDSGFGFADSVIVPMHSVDWAIYGLAKRWKRKDGPIELRVFIAGYGADSSSDEVIETLPEGIKEYARSLTS